MQPHSNKRFNRTSQAVCGEAPHSANTNQSLIELCPHPQIRIWEPLTDCSHTLDPRGPPCHAHGQARSSLPFNHQCESLRAHLPLSPRQRRRSLRVAPYLFPASSPGCQSPSGWISGRGSTCPSPPSSVCGALAHLRRGGGTQDSRSFKSSRKQHDGT